jgi:hypothetical protein
MAGDVLETEGVGATFLHIQPRERINKIILNHPGMVIKQ